MKTTEKTDIALPLSPQISQGNGADHSIMPPEFAGMYQAGFDAGYKGGKEAGYRQGFVEGVAAVHQGPNDGASSAVEGKPAPKSGPRRMLVGMPCKRCRVYLVSDETHCPCCKQSRAG
jgi:hypothetical protein